MRHSAFVIRHSSQAWLRDATAIARFHEYRISNAECRISNFGETKVPGFRPGLLGWFYHPGLSRMGVASFVCIGLPGRREPACLEIPK
jgi:hypothetical protein